MLLHNRTAAPSNRQTVKPLRLLAFAPLRLYASLVVQTLTHDLVFRLQANPGLRHTLPKQLLAVN